MSKAIKNLINQKESEHLEFKSSVSELKEIIQTISAFANKNGGNIIIGVSPLGKFLGVHIGKNTIENLSNKIKENTDPKIFPEIKIEKINGKEVIGITIEQSILKPVFAFGRAYKRVGKTNQKITSEEIRKIARETEKVYWDEQVCKQSALTDIDEEFVQETFIPLYEKVSKTRIISTPRSMLASLNGIKDNKLTNAGILLFGKTPQKFFANTHIAVARYRGKEVGKDRLDYKEFEGNLIIQIDNCDRYIKEHIAVMSLLLPHKIEREDIPEYCWFSMRELLTNAVCHRDYSEKGSKVIIKIFDDRIEYYNPGGLAKGINPQNIVEKQFSRNPIITKVFAKIRYIEELGEGWNKIIHEHKMHLLKPKMPKISADEHSVLVTLFSTKLRFEKGNVELNERQKKAVQYTRKKGKITNSEYQRINKIQKKTATRDLQGLARREILLRKGRTGKGVFYIVSPLYKGT